jgi:hypothetical protein
MRHLLLILLVGLLSSFGPQKFNSNLSIPAGEQFYLGGGQSNSFKASAKNIGTVPVELFLLLEDGDETLVLTLQPGESAKATAPAKSAMLFKNTSDQLAKLRVKANVKPESLSMYYKEVTGK